jgi:hypothetical protein
MLTLAGDGLPIRRHFDWTVGVGPGGGGGGGVATSPPSSLVLFGDPCTDRDVEQRAKVCLVFCSIPCSVHTSFATARIKLCSCCCLFF